MRPILSLCASLVALSACSTNELDLDLRDLGRGFDTSDAVSVETAARPRPDDRGVISYPNYQVVVARRGDTVADVAARLGTIAPEELARYNGVPVNAPLNQGEILALPRRVAEPSPATGAAGTGPILPADNVDIETLAGGAIDRAGTTGGGTQVASQQIGQEPVRHQVAAGETAYSIARLYGVSPKSLAEWNGLGPDLEVRAGQYLLIPVVIDRPAARPATASATSAPGQGSQTPTPPSAAAPLPDERTAPVAATATAESPEVEGTPESPDLGQQATEASSTRMTAPVGGSIIRDFSKGRNDGIDISASSGEAVKAADGGVVAAITEDTDQVPIVVLRHEGGVLTVYANVEDLKVKKGDRVSRGQPIATVRDAASPFLHFEVREGVEAVDPTPYLN
ncbi:M23 family metallopeptidase [Tropicimonas marinistellae]|uniref:M23 family metallopeptidase n=1 Tax=Tropicimonas marinistellae TaxID=1739787 RepID=UPI00082A911B|nr:M23 family metallopeptidase [Tropicimonas marinistellae]